MKIEEEVLIGVEKEMNVVPFSFINEEATKQAENARQRTYVFSDDKRKLHHFVVRELPRHGKPMSLGFISESLKMTPEQVGQIVDDLENDKTFLFRNNSEAINWAYPVSVDTTPHHITFSTGEKVNAA